MLKRIIFISILGFVSMLALWSVAFSLISEKVSFLVYLYPGTILLPVLSPIIPQKAADFIFPLGGLDATTAFIILFATFFWWSLCAISASFVIRKRTGSHS